MRNVSWYVLLFAFIGFVPFARGAENAPAGYLVFVSNERSGDVSVIDGETNEVQATIPVGMRPRGLHCSPDGRLVYVALSGSPLMGPGVDRNYAEEKKSIKSADGVAVIDATDLRVVNRLEAGSDPEQFALSKDGTRLYIADEDVATATVVSLPSGSKLAEVKVSEEPEGVAVNPATGRVYVTCEEKGLVFSFGPGGEEPIHQFKVGGRPRSMAFLPDGSRGYVPAETDSLLSIIDTSKDEVIGTIPTGPGTKPMGTAMTRDGRELYVTTGRGNSVAVIDTASNKVVDSVAVGSRVWGIALSPDETKAYTCNGLSNDVSLVDLKNRRELKRIKVGQAPWGVAVVAKR